MDINQITRSGSITAVFYDRIIFLRKTNTKRVLLRKKLNTALIIELLR